MTADTPKTRAQLRERLARNNERVKYLAGPLTPEQLKWRPNDASWNIGQCLYHLTVSSTEYFAKLPGTFERAPQRPADHSDEPFRHGITGRLLIWAVSPDTTWRLKAPSNIRPAPTAAATLDEFLETQDQLGEWIERSESIDVLWARFRSPENRLIRLNVADAFVVLLVHQQRHLNQIERIRKAEGFPAA